ncbi:MAG: tol-pal system-associated acyl-CoA thioesterase [Amaricoccus sp.]
MAEQVSGSDGFRLRVYYEDTDLAGIVYHANYLKFIERARSEALLGLGVDQLALQAEAGLVFAVRRIEADFLAPARFQDRLLVTTRLLALGGARIDLDQRIWREESCLFRAVVVLACLDAGGRPQRLPASVRAAAAGLAKPG